MRALSSVRCLSAIVTAALAIAGLCAPALAETLTLDQALQRALAFAPTITSASAQSDLSAAIAREARAPLYPTLSANSEYMQAPGYSIAVTNGGLSTALLSLNYTAFDFGRRLAAARAALYQSEADSFGVRAARTQIIFDTTVAYYDLVRAQEIEREYIADDERLKRYVTVIKALRKSGRALANDELKVQTASNSAALARASAHYNVERAAALLGVLIGRPEAPDVSAAEVNGVPAWPGKDLSRNPMLEAAQRSVASARSAVQAAERERYPTVKLALTAGWQGINPPHTFAHNGGASYDGLVSMPIFDGGVISAHVDEARAKVAAAQAQVRQVELDLRKQLADAEPRYRQALDQLAMLSDAEPTAQDNFALTWARFLGGGNVTLLEVLDAFAQLEQLRVARPDQAFAARQAAAQGALVLGRDQ
ncbi:MAG TPA: TolC family protein [Candidatus Binataceae bacterium]